MVVHISCIYLTESQLVLRQLASKVDKVYTCCCFFAREVWCIADVSRVSPSSEQTGGLGGNLSLNGVLIYADQQDRLWT